MGITSLKLGIAAGILVAGLAGAAPAQAQLFFTDPVLERGPVEPTDPVVGLPLPGATAAEARAGLLWNLRAALNVAALQCQFSRYLRTVDNYNAMLAHHSGELQTAYRTLEGYFRRTAGARGQRELDLWTTRTYANFTTLGGQFSFCQTAANVGREALAQRKGGLYDVARNRMREIRASLRPNQDRLMANALPTFAPLPASLFATPNCSGLRGRELERCRAS